MTDVMKQVSKKLKRAARRPRGGGVYVDGKRVEGTKAAGTAAHDKRVDEREARKTIKQKETDDGR